MTGPELRAIRRQLGLSQAEFARLFETDARTIRRWELEERSIPGPARVLALIVQDHPGLFEHYL